jgi:dissimilatory sulfite reductase (desulfoviridin) alpha/beta subunit
MGRSIAPMLGVEINLYPALLNGCGNCAQEVCFVDAITILNGKAKIEMKNCRCCGRCAEICSNGAITV